jgi:cold shock CspA family protein
MIEGTVVSYTNERGFGFVRADDADKDTYFHCTGQVDRDWTPVVGQRVGFELGSNDQGAIALNLSLLDATTSTSADPAAVPGVPAPGDSMSGAVRWFDEGKGFGFIRGDDGEDYHVGTRDIVNVGYRCLAEGEPVTFQVGLAVDGRAKAVNVQSVARTRGTVKNFDHQRGCGLITPADGGRDLFFHHSGILRTQGKPTAVPGEDVEYDVEYDEERRRDQAVRVRRLDPRLPLFRFAYMGDEQAWLDELAALAKDEPWDYSHISSEARPHRTDKPILWSYVIYTFARLEEENDRDGDKILTASFAGKEWTCFNTGLISDLEQEIFALFVSDRSSAVQREGNVRRLDRFCVSSDRFLLDRFPTLPKLANYFDDPSVLLYDRRLKLHIDLEHVMRDNVDRFPAAIRSNEHIARQLVSHAASDTEQRVYRNYKTAIPQYFHGSVQLLLPLCLESPDRADLALVVSRHDGADGQGYYRGETVLTLEMAYNNARLLTRPDDEWLRP